jgi:hypothetical protein
MSRVKHKLGILSSEQKPGFCHSIVLSVFGSKNAWGQDDPQRKG